MCIYILHRQKNNLPISSVFYIISKHLGDASENSMVATSACCYKLCSSVPTWWALLG